MKKILFLSFILLSINVLAQQHDSYSVKEGDTLENIAKIFRVSPNDIKEANPSLQNGLKKGMLLLIPNGKAKYYNTKQPIGFRLHIVKDKETLFGLAQQYSITQDDLRRYNNVLYSRDLQKKQELTIPVYSKEEQAVTKGKEGVVKYVVKPGEGKWRIAQNHGITQQELEKLNPSMPDPLKEGMEIWIPTHTLGMSKYASSEDKKMVLYQVEKGEGFLGLERKFNLTQQQLIALNPDLEDGIKLEAQIWIPKENFMEYSATFNGNQQGATPESNDYLRTRMQPNQVKNIAYVLPFRLKEIKEGNYADMKNKLKSDKFTLASADFYAGALLAIDSLQKLGFSLNVNVFDTEGSVEKVKEITENEAIKNAQVIIGPFLAVEFNKLSDGVRRSSTALIAPMSNKNIELRSNVFQSLPTTEVQQQKMIDFVNKKYPDANIVLLSDARSKDLNEKLAVSFAEAKVVDNINSVKNALVKEKTNIVFVSSNDVVFLSDVIRILHNTAGLGKREKQFNIIMAALEKGDAYDHDSISNPYLSELKFTYPSVNRYAGENNGFIRKYNEIYKTSPSRYAFRGFDLTMDAVLRTSLSGDFISATLSLYETSYQENKFFYTKNPSKGDGYENQGVYIVRYDDLEVKEIY